MMHRKYDQWISIDGSCCFIMAKPKVSANLEMQFKGFLDHDFTFTFWYSFPSYQTWIFFVYFEELLLM